MYEALGKARDMFKLYAELHRAKGTADSDAKAKVNEDMVATINEALSVQPAEPVDDPVTVPRGLLGAACAAIERKRDAPKTLAELRRYTVGDLSAAPPPAKPMTTDTPKQPDALRQAEPLSNDDIWLLPEMRGWFPQDHYRLLGVCRAVERLITERMSAGGKT